jgi:hypothetical protein
VPRSPGVSPPPGPMVPFGPTLNAFAPVVPRETILRITASQVARPGRAGAVQARWPTAQRMVFAAGRAALTAAVVVAVVVAAVAVAAVIPDPAIAAATAATVSQ